MDIDTNSIVAAVSAVGTLFGIPAAIRALSEARTKAADAGVKRAEAARIAAEAKKTEAEAKKTEAEAVRATADTTGRFLAGAEADAAQVRKWVDDLRGRLDRCERRHEDCEARVVAVERKCDEEHAVKDAQIKALFRECGDLRASIESGGGR